MGDGPATGLAAVIERQQKEDRAEGLGLFDRATQLSLIPTDADEDVDDGEVVEVMRGPGRPKGARNKRAEDWSKFILARYTSPLVGMAETYCRDVRQLAIELNCTLLEAGKLQLAAQQALAPYIHQRLPQAVELTGGDGAPLMALVVSPAVALLKDAAGGGRLLSGTLVGDPGEDEGEEESEENQ